LLGGSLNKSQRSKYWNPLKPGFYNVISNDKRECAKAEKITWMVYAEIKAVYNCATDFYNRKSVGRIPYVMA